MNKQASLSILFLFYFFLAYPYQRKDEKKNAVSRSTTEKEWTFSSTPSWADEFDNDGLPDETKWGYDVGGSGWGNNELQFYTEATLSNVKIENGILILTAKKENMNERAYTSARLVSKGKGDFLYGRIEARAKLPAGKGTWPAIWMLPTDWAYGSWPASGEIDIMEHVGYDQDNVHISIHSEAYNHGINTQKTGTKKIQNATTEYHTYRVDWTPDAISGFIDDEQIFVFKRESGDYKVWPFNKKFHLLLNLAVGGNWGGAKGVDEQAFPASMEVDYIRVYPLVE